MSNKFDINKDDLWNKIIQDERMPKNKRQSNRSYKYALLGLFVFIMFGSVYIFNTEPLTLDQTVNNPETNATTIHDQTNNTNSESDNLVAEDSSAIIPRALKDVEDLKEIDHTMSMGMEPTLETEKNILNKNTDINNTIPKRETPPAQQDTFIQINTLQASTGYDNERHLKTGIEQEEHQDITVLNENATKSNNVSTGVDLDPAQKNQNRSTSDQPELAMVDIINKESRDDIELFQLDILPIALLSNADPIVLQTPNNILEIRRIKQNHISIYSALNYGIASSTLYDRMDAEIDQSTILEGNFKAYQIEVGLLKSFGPWRIQAGLGADVQVGRAVVEQTDTIYNRLDMLSTFERVEETRTSIRHQRYGNVFVSARLGYELTKGAWSLVPQAGLRFNVMNLSDGTLVHPESLEQIAITGTESRDSYAIILGLGIERQLFSDFSVSLGTR